MKHVPSLTALRCLEASARRGSFTLAASDWPSDDSQCELAIATQFGRKCVTALPSFSTGSAESSHSSAARYWTHSADAHHRPSTRSLDI